uniref:Uncharacterized protein n=1 Tax=Anguilla anguilla TaxID=7936 RepID=A0A0E9WGZ2_ANGAN
MHYIFTVSFQIQCDGVQSQDYKNCPHCKSQQCLTAAKSQYCSSDKKENKILINFNKPTLL